MWVMTFHSACARMLRADAERLGYTRGFTIYDEQDSLRQVKACVDELDVDPKRFAPRGLRRQISDAKNALLDAEAYRLKVSSFFEQTAADVYDLYEQRMHAANAMDFDDLLFRCVNLFELFPEVRDRYRARLPARAGGRVPGHQPRPVPLAPAALRGAPQPVRRRRRRSVDLRLPRRRHPQHPRLRGRLPGHRGGEARAELPLDADHPERGQCGDLATTARRKRKSLWSEVGEGSTRCTSGSWRTSTPRPASWSPRSSASWTTAARATTSPSSTGRMRSRGCSRTCSSATAWATRSSAARASTSAPRSRTRSRI